VYVDDRKNRTQRNTLALKNVDYIIAATVHVNTEHYESDNVHKYMNMFRSRTRQGACYRQPVLGVREFAADFMQAPEHFTPIDPKVSRPLGAMNYGVEYLSKGVGTLPMFFDARLDGGILHVPTWNNVACSNGVRPQSMRAVAC
jgi:CRISPR-associated protein Cas5d